MSRKVLLATLGSLGDLHPFIAVARALKERGYAPVIATTPDFRDNVLGEGIGFHAVGPSRAQVLQDLRMDTGELGKRVAKDTMFILEAGVFPYLRGMYDDLALALEDASLLLSSTLMYTARLAAEVRGLPHLSVALQPMVFLSAYDPPAIGTAPWIAPLVSKLGPTATRALYGAAKALAKRRARALDQFRAELGLPRPQGSPLFEGQFSPHGTLATFSKVLGSVQPDYPPKTTITGFPFYDRARQDETCLAADLEAFVSAGPPPLVFTLGTFAVDFPGEFFSISREVVRRLGRRAVLLVGRGESDRLGSPAAPDVFVADYVPYSQLLARAAAVIHHGGIGTTGQSLRAGKPQFVVPILSDQFDNAARISRLGVGRWLRFSRYAAGPVSAAISALVTDPRYGARAAAVGEQIRREDGAGTAARVIDTLLGARAGAV